MNPKNDFLYPEWQIPVQEAMLEPDRATLLLKVQVAEAKISERLRQIERSSGGSNERDAMNRALKVMAAMRCESFAG
jgi:hypothetical protein